MNAEPVGDRESSVCRAAELVGLFCADPREFGRIEAVTAAHVPPVPRALLDHHSHMTVTMERHHGCPMTLRVAAVRDGDASGRGYAREILLATPDGTVVQHGIVRMDLSTMDPATADAIRGRGEPLGRIFVAAGMLCEVQRVELLRIEAGPHLRAILGPSVNEVYGRVAEIAVAGRRVIELLEIAAPAS